LTISDGYIVEAADLDSIWSTGLAQLRTTTAANSARRQFPVVFSFRGVTNAVSRTYTYTPRTDVVLKSATISAASTSAGIVCSVEIPAQIIDQERIVGGNIPYDLTGSATTSATLTAGFGDIGRDNTAIPATERLILLAGDNIDITVQSSSATAADIHIIFLLETEMVE
jgi:hypothetical protein